MTANGGSYVSADKSPSTFLIDATTTAIAGSPAQTLAFGHTITSGSFDPYIGTYGAAAAGNQTQALAASWH
jgi:hypothetical protein